VPAEAPPLLELVPPVVDVVPPEAELVPPLPEPPLLGTHTGHFDEAHSPTDSTALSHALDMLSLPPEPVLQLEHKAEYCEPHMLSTQLVQAGVASD
jgi:hypothetical protein